jgi:hypothetical protein
MKTKCIHLLKLEEDGQKKINTLYISDSGVKNKVLIETRMSEELDSLLQGDLFNENPQVLRKVNPVTEPELFLDALRHRFKSPYYLMSEVEELEI